MGALPMPDIPPGPQRDLLRALHEMHHRAGWPSLRTLARAAGCSPTTVSAAFSSPRLPSWGILELLVEEMSGDVPEFHQLWLAAGVPAGTRSGATAPRIAGRRAELAAVRRHLETAAGLLLVSGEAGIGKTRLITTAVDTSETSVASGSCLPLSAEVPLLPVADLLRSVHEIDEGLWLREALAACPTYVPASLRRLLPELDEPIDGSEPEDEWSRQRLFSAVSAVLSELGASRQLAVRIEDLHWADTATLDLFEYLLMRGLAVPFVGTWRSEDPSTPTDAVEWLTRIRRLPTVTELTLGPLDRDQTIEQLTLLGAPAGADDVDRIFQRSRGLPLFTEQLVAHSGDSGMLPEQLADLLDRRLEGLDPPAWAITRCLGAADRPLPEPLLRAVSALAREDFDEGLHALDRRRLLATADRDVALRHPLLAEAVRRRLLPGAAVDTHRRLALALAEAPEKDAAEIATHWQAAADLTQELTWRIRAARAATARFAFSQAVTQWQRAREVWPDECQRIEGLSRVDAGLAAVDALIYITEIEQAQTLAEALAQGSMSEDEAGNVLLRRSQIGILQGDTAEALRMATEAVGIFEGKGPSVALARALTRVVDAYRNIGRHIDADAAIARALETCTAIGDTTEKHRILVLDVWNRTELGDLDGALAALELASTLPVSEPDPITDIFLAGCHTELLLHRSAPADEIEEAGRRGIDAAERWDLVDHFGTAILRANIAEGHLRAGHIDRAAGLIDSATDTDPVLRTWVMHYVRVQLDTARGRLEDALARILQLDQIPVALLSNKLERDAGLAPAELWADQPEAALKRLLVVLDEATGSEASQQTSECFALAARAAADLADIDPRRRRALLQRVHGLTVQTAFAGDKESGIGRACAVTGRAELARLAGKQSVELWADAATEWDTLTRTVDAAYCRWRAAQAALATGQATLAQRLLKRAATDARAHVPLRTAIRHTAGRE